MPCAPMATNASSIYRPDVTHAAAGRVRVPQQSGSPEDAPEIVNQSTTGRGLVRRLGWENVVFIRSSEY